MIHFCHLKENRAGNMTNVNKVMDSNQILQNFDRQKWMYSFNYCQMTCDISVICCLMCVSQKKCFAAFWFGNLHIPDSKNCTSHTATDHVLSVSHPISPTLFRKLHLRPAVCEHPTRDYFIFVFSCWKVKTDFKTETVCLLSLKIWSGVPPLQQFRLHF